MVWTVTHEFEQPVRHKNQMMSGGSFMANLTLRLNPDLDCPDVRFASIVPGPDAAYFSQFVEAGLRSFIADRASEGIAIGFLQVTLTAITIHCVDAKPHRFEEATKMALNQGFDLNRVEL